MEVNPQIYYKDLLVTSQIGKRGMLFQLIRFNIDMTSMIQVSIVSIYYRSLDKAQTFLNRYY